MKVAIKHLSAFNQDALLRTYAAMSPGRRLRIDRYAHQEDRLRSLAGECLAREMLCAFTGLDPHRISIVETGTGKPVSSIPGTHFSISHSGQLIACAVACAPVGIDAEHIRPIPRRVAEMICNKREANYILRDTPAGSTELTGDSLLRFFSVWTFKEAYAKLTGEGLPASPSADYFQFKPRILSFSYEGCLVSVLSEEKNREP